MRELIWPSRCAGCGTLGEGDLCGPCRPRAVHRVGVRPEGVSGTFSLAGYQTGLGDALRYAKHGPDRRLTFVLGALFADRVAPAVAGHVDAIVPAPSPWTRRLQRGFSPPAVLAHCLSRRLGVPVVHALSASGGPRQAGLDAQGRARNLRGRIRSRRPAPGTVLLVDDVVTTGATASACARELLGETTRTVWLATLCATRRQDF